ncbi:UPF0182 family membrane protein [Alkalithermobacter paradoxus]|uniref:UPF0182 protein CLOTH_20060 n=1 Tax=Alkalithermobacter paradoxus TaxID=29349 RepID=A0A1V4I534_9FIRM|nr:hypothetical protein CLOTH_20060 [[Clostridium] thermoalcaliphilum]
MKRLQRTGLFLGLFLLFVLIGSFSQIINFIANYNWFKEVGYVSTYTKIVFSRLYIGVPIFLVLNTFIYLYLMNIKRNYYKNMNILGSSEDDKNINTATFIVSSIVSFIFSVGISSSFWMEILKFKNSTQFNVTDPIFNKDISFYVFKLPLISEILSSLIGILVLLFIITLVYYLILISMKSQNKFYDFDKSKVWNLSEYGSIPKRILTLAFNKITIIGAVFFIIIAIQSYLSSFSILYSTRGIIHGAGFTDVHVTLLGYRIKSILSIVTSILIIIANIKQRYKLVLIGPILLVAVTILTSIGESAVQNFIVSPNEISRESTYIQYNIDYTKKAYDINNIREEDFAALSDLSLEDIINNEETVKNIPINDYRPTIQTYNQIQGIRSYYRFNDVDIDRYMIDGKLTQVFLSPREIDKSKLPQQAQTWINKHLKYTHGYGIVMSPVNEVTPSGQPKTIIRNIPPITESDSLRIERPEIYFGELTNDYIVINTKEDEFDYPKGETNAFTRYEGSAGIKLTPFNRLLYSIDRGSFKLLVSGAVNSDSRIILNRNISDRIKMIAPFITYDEDPYIVLVDGKLYWIIDGYTSTSRYPYSQPYEHGKINYIRNSVKVVVDAYNGSVDYYISDDKDPIIKTYSKIFKDLFKPIDNMPQGIRNHIRYPQSVFDIQSRMYGTYHMKDIGVFYNKEDQWEIATEIYEGKNDPVEVESNYITFKLPGESKAEFLLTVPYTPRAKQNMIAMLVARNDNEKYGELVVYRFPKEKNILGPYQVESRINQDPEISRNLTQWDSGGSKVIRGHMITVPIEESILYVEPLYIKSDSKESIPEVKKIIMIYNDKIVMEDTLEDAINKLFKSEGKVVDEKRDIVYREDLSSNDLLLKANELYDRAQEAIRNGNFTDYGKYIDELGDVLRKLKPVE